MGLGIDIGAASVKVLEVERRGDKVRVVGGGRVRWQDYTGSAEDRAAQQRALMTIMARAGQKWGTAYAGATGRDVNLRFAQVPNVGGGQLDNLINFEVQQLIGKIGQVYCDRTLLPSEPGATELPLLVGLIRTEYADARVKFLRECGVEPRDVVPNSLALYEVFLQSPECKPGETVLLADLGAENIDVIIVEDRRLAFARNINGGGKTCSEAIASLLKIPIVEAEKAKFFEMADLSRAREADAKSNSVRQALLNSCGQIANLLTSSINFARVQTKKPLPVARVLLSGGAARLPGFARYLEEMIKMPVVNFDPFAGWDVSECGLAKEFFDSPTDLAVAAGLALMAGGKPATKLSFLPRQMREAREFTKRGAVAAAGLALLLLAGLAQAVTALSTKSAATDELKAVQAAKADLDANAARTEELKEERDRLRAKLGVLAREAEAGGFLMRAMAAARESKPDGIWLTEVELVPATEGENLPRGFKVLLRGIAEDPEEGQGTLNEYINALKKHPLGLTAVGGKKFEPVPNKPLWSFVLELQ